MPLDFVPALVPLSSGLGEVHSELIRPAMGESAFMHTALNCQFNRLGSLTKRYGFTNLGVLTDNPGISVGTPRHLASTGESLILLDERVAWRYNPGRSRWLQAGAIAPGGLEYGPGISGPRNYQDADVASGSGHVFVGATTSWVTTDFSGNTTHYAATYFAMTDGGVVVQPPRDILETTVAADRRRDSKCAATTGKIIWAMMRGSGSPGELEVYQWDSATPTLSPTQELTVSSNAVVGRDRWDLIGLANGNYAVAYIDNTSGNIEVEIRDPAHAVVASETLTDSPYNGVSIAEDAQADIIITAFRNLANDVVVAYRLEVILSTINVAWGPTTLYTASASDEDGEPENFTYPGVVAASTHNLHVWCTGNLIDKRYIQYAEVNNTTGALSNGPTAIMNARPSSKPWAHGGRYYMAATTFVNRYPFEVSCVVELYLLFVGVVRNPVTTTEQATLAAVYHVGTSAHIGPNRSSVYQSGSKTSWLGFSFTDATPSDPDGITRFGQADANSVIGCEVVTLDYDAAITSVVVAKGELVIGGSLVAYMGRGSAEELGHVVPPVPRQENDIASELTHASANPGLAAGTYSWLAIWAWLDASGVLHRSLPSPAIQLTVSASGPNPSYVNLIAKTNGLTNRLESKEESVHWFRAGADGIFKRVKNEHVENKAQSLSSPSYATDALIDEDDQQTVLAPEPLYTTGGVLENVIPAGANIVGVVSDRLWLGGDRRVQFSKKLTPATTTQHRLAPETNEGFVRPTPTGGPVTGLADLDGSPVMFTRDEIYIIRGNGPNDVGGGGSYDLVLVSNDGGCKDPRSVVAGPEGVFFQGGRGIYLLSRGFQVSFSGAPVIDKTDAFPVITSAIIDEAYNHVRFTCTNAAATDGIILVFDYLARAWTHWQIKDSAGAVVVPVSACMHDGEYHIAGNDGSVRRYDSTTYADDATEYVQMKVRTSWVQGAKQSGWQRVRRVTLLGKRLAAHELTVNVYSDFGTTADQQQGFTWTNGQILDFEEIGSREMVEIVPRRQKCTAIAVEVSDSEPTPASQGAGIELSGLRFEIGVKKGAVKLPSRQG